MSAVVSHFPTRLAHLLVSKRGWMINVYIKVQSAVKTPTPTYPSCSLLCWIKSPQLLLLVLSESCVRFSLKHFRPLWPHMLLLFSPAGLDYGRKDKKRERERSGASVHTLTRSVCCHPPCCVAHDEPLFPFAVFCCELSVTFFAVFKKNWWRVHVIITSAPDQGLPAAMLVLYVDLE